MTRYAVALAWLLLVWVALWRDLSLANVLSGLVLGAVTLALFPLPSAGFDRRLRPVPFVRFGLLFAWSVVKANVIVAWEVVTPRNRINEGIVAVPLRTRDPVIITIVSHSIILAPGTMVVDIDMDPETVLFVHALHLRSADEVRREVQTLERLALAALGSVEQRPTLVEEAP
jgi:multicomponent Na+:H+ antiporter subunit E